MASIMQFWIIKVSIYLEEVKELGFASIGASNI